MADTQDSLKKSKEFRQFYGTLQLVQLTAMDYVLEGNSDEEIKNRAKEVTKVLADGMKGVGAPRYPLMSAFDNSQCWDPATKQFVAC
jgi:hypothetical protein